MCPVPDEMEGPYKVVGHLHNARETGKYSIVMEQKGGIPYFTEIIPDVGTSETARTVCNLLNKEHKRIQQEITLAEKAERRKRMEKYSGSGRIFVNGEPDDNA